MMNKLMDENPSRDDENDLDDHWLEIVIEAMESGVSKEQFKKHLTYHKRKNNKKEP